MNRLKCFMVLVTMFFFVIVVNAGEQDFEYRADPTKNNKAVVNINGANIHFTAWLSANLQSSEDGDYTSDSYLIDNITITNKGGDVNINIKRSEINKILRSNKFENVSLLISIYGDYLDLQRGNKYYMFWRGYTADGFFFETYEQNYAMRTYNVLEVYHGAGELAGTFFNELSTNRGGMYVFQTDEYPSYENGKYYQLDEFKNNSGKILELASNGVQVNVIEDEKIDIGENKIVTPSGNVDENGVPTSTDIKEVDMNNFYAVYNDNNQLKYSWTLYDEEGNPKDIKIDTAITMDESENEEEILSAAEQLFEDIGKTSIITFHHDGEIGGVAKIKLYVGDTFNPGDKVYMYFYNPDDKSLSLQSVDAQNGNELYEVAVDEDGFIEIQFTHCSEYLLTNVKETQKAKAFNENKNVKNKDGKINPIIVGIASGVLVALFVGSIIIIKKRKSENKV